MKTRILILLMMMGLAANGQYVVGKRDNALLIKNNILGVVFMEKDEKEVKKLSEKPEELQAYEKAIEIFNVLLRKAIENEWTVSKQIVFLSKDDAETILKEKDLKYCLLMVGERSSQKLGDFSGIPGYAQSQPFGLSQQALRYATSTAFRSKEIKIIWTASRKRSLASSFFPAADLSIGSVTYMVQNLNNQVAKALDGTMTSLSAWKSNIKNSTHLMKEKTLLVPEPLVSKPLQKVIDNGTFEKYYTNKFKVVTTEKLDSIITSRNKDYAYGIVVPSGYQGRGGVLYNYYVVDAADGAILFANGTSVVGSKGKFHWFQLRKLDKRLK